MSAPQVPFNTSLGQVRQHIVYTLTRVTIDPRGAPFVDEISFLRSQIEEGRDNIELLEIRLRELLTKKEALDREASEEKIRLEKIEALKQELALLQSKKR